MNYTSWTFWILFAIVFLPYWRLSHKRQNTLLLVASYVFYGFWDYRFLFLILISTVIDYIGGLGVAGVSLPRRSLRGLAAVLIGSSFALCSNISYPKLWQALLRLDGQAVIAALPQQWTDFGIPLATTALTLGYGFLLPHLYAAPVEQRRRLFLAISMVANLAILGFFKYCDFFIDSFAGLLGTVGLGHMAGSTLGIILPAGISFYTFQAMSYTIDIYRNEVEPTRDFGDFALFVCFFPHLVAGPIMRAHTLLPQVVKPRHMKPGDWEEGLILVLAGLFKKMVIADNMAPIANSVFYQFADGGMNALTGPEVLIGIYAFAFQIYGDFSGYSSIARGISKWIGFDLVVNFNLPYLAVSPSDFWKRWHISLSSWLRDYLYIPLGGNRGGNFATYRNLMATMVLGGLWHGASWTFVAWGFFHGAILCLFRWLNISDKIPTQTWGGRVQWLGRVMLMFHLTCIGWLLFRADSFGAVIDMSARVLTDFTFTPMFWAGLVMLVFFGIIPFLLEWATSGELRLDRVTRTSWATRGLAYACVVLILILFHAGMVHEFIYFQF